eukprot:5113025-Pyramimonas_sp.AAC.1
MIDHLPGSNKVPRSDLVTNDIVKNAPGQTARIRHPLTMKSPCEPQLDTAASFYKTIGDVSSAVHYRNILLSRHHPQDVPQSCQGPCQGTLAVIREEQ